MTFLYTSHIRPVDFALARWQPTLACDIGLLAISRDAWLACRKKLHALLENAPGGRASVRQCLRDLLGADPDQCYLVKAGEGTQSAVALNFTELCVFVRRRQVAPEQLQGWQPRSLVFNAITRKSAAQWLQWLAKTPIESFTANQWDTYWSQRSTGTATSRKDHFAHLYSEHLQAAMQAAEARFLLSEQQLRPGWAALENPGSMRSDGNQLYVETIDLGRPGALVISEDSEPTAQLLYLPWHSSPLLSFPSRLDMESFLREQAPQLLGQALYNHPPTYQPSTQGLDVAGLEVLAHWRKQLLDSLLITPGDDLASHAEFSLDAADLLDLKRRDPQLLAPAPEVKQPKEGQRYPGSFFDLGYLYADIPYEMRQHQIRRMRNATAGLNQDDQALLRSGQKNLDNARVRAASQTLDSLDVSISPSPGSPLHKAHADGLRAEAHIQKLLGLINAEDMHSITSLLEPALDTTTSPNAVAYYPTLTRTNQAGNQTTVQSLPLQQVLVISAQADPEPDASVLIYWPGKEGGLLRCAKRKHLPKYFALDEAALHLTLVSGNALEHVLKQQFLDHAHQTQALATAPAHGETEPEHTLTALNSRFLDQLQIPTHQARDLACAELDEQQSSLLLLPQLASWLVKMPDARRQTLKQLTHDFIAAMHRSQTLLAKSHSPQALFVRSLINQQLALDIADFDNSTVTLDLPQEVTFVKTLVSGSGAPGTPSRMVPKPSTERIQLTLDTLVLSNIDSTLSLQLDYLIVKPATASAPLQHTLHRTLTKAYLIKLVQQLDVAQQYEQHLLKAYRGLDEDTFARDFRRECLSAPFILMLKIQALYAQYKGDLSSAASAVLSAAADNAGDIRLYPVHLTPGGSDTADKATTLSGVTLVHEVKTKLTLLYLPDHPTTPVRWYTSLEGARLGLYELCKQNALATYLAHRALKGDPRQHLQRINQAVLQHFQGLIGIGPAWPASTSLAEHLLDAQAGRLLEAHRSTSRSNHALWLENFAYQSAMVFNYLRMALGFVPFVGTALSLYDFFEACANATQALIKGEVGKALNDLEQALVCLIDAAMDLVPAALAKPSALRKLVVARQQRALAQGPAKLLKSQPQAALEHKARFADYEYAMPLSLNGLQPARSGRFRGIYRHAEGDFIQIEGTPFNVQWDTNAHTWRLSGTTLKTYRQPIALDEHGRWDTHGVIYGRLLEGGLQGGMKRIRKLFPSSVQVKPYQHLPDNPYEIPVSLRGYEEAAVFPGMFKEYLAYNNPVIDDLSVAYQSAREKLAQDVISAANQAGSLPPRPELPNLAEIPDTTQMLKALWQKSNGVVMGEAHSSIGSKQLLIDNMKHLAKENVQVLYMEHAMSDLHADAIATFNRTGKLNGILEKFLTSQDRGHHTDPAGKYTYTNLYKAAHQHGIRIQAIDCMASYATSLRVQVQQSRIALFNYYATSIIRQDQQLNGPCRWAALVGTTHSNTLYNITGLSERLGAIGVMVRDVSHNYSQPGFHLDPGTLVKDSQLGSRPSYPVLRGDIVYYANTLEQPAFHSQQQAVRRPGQFTFADGETQLILIHRNRTNELVHTPVSTDGTSVWIIRPLWPTISGTHYPTVDALGNALEAGLKFERV